MCRPLGRSFGAKVKDTIALETMPKSKGSFSVGVIPMPKGILIMTCMTNKRRFFLCSLYIREGLCGCTLTSSVMSSGLVHKKKSLSKGKQYTCNAIFAITEKSPGDAAMLTDSEMKKVVFVAEPEEALPSGTRCSKDYRKDYNEIIVNPSKPIEEPNEQPTKLVQAKQKVL